MYRNRAKVTPASCHAERSDILCAFASLRQTICLFDAKTRRREEDEDRVTFAVLPITTVVNIFAERLPPITPPSPPARGGEPMHCSPPQAGGLGGVIQTTTVLPIYCSGSGRQ